MPKHPMDFDYLNDISFARFRFTLVNDFKNEHDSVRADLAHLKDSPVILLGMYY